jgi:hypothetical protein
LGPFSAQPPSGFKQNWHSEFLAVGSMAAFAIYLRQRGSPESKPVRAAHDETAASGERAETAVVRLPTADEPPSSEGAS